MARKTLGVDNLVTECNRMLQLETVGHEEKRGICMVLEHVLRIADRYNGFNYNYWLAVGYKEWSEAGRPDKKDQYIYGPKGRKGNEYARTYYY